MSLTEVLVSSSPRESAGADTSKRYDYQKDLCLFMLIELHNSGEEFVMLLDYFDDITLLDNPINPQKVKFFQVKTKGAGHWLVKDFIKEEDGKLSIIGKLYANKIQFSDYTESLNFITNASIKIELPEEGKDTATLTNFCASQLKDSVIHKINEHLKNQLKLEDDVAFENITFFQVHGLSLTDSATHCVGALNQLFEKLNPDFNGNPNLAYKKIFNEIKIKTGKSLKTDSEINDLSFIIREKGITRQEFKDFLNAAGVYRNPEQIWNHIHTDLAAAGAGVGQINQLKAAWRNANVNSLNQINNIPVTKTIEHIQNIIAKVNAEPEHLSLNLVDLIECIINECKPLPYDVFDDGFIKGTILKELYNG